MKSNTETNVTDLANSLLASARELVPTLAKRAALAEHNRSIPAETIDDLKRAGLFRVIQPKRYGGYELDPGVFFDIQMTLAEGCMSTGWVYGVVAVHNWQLALFDPRAQEDVWAKDSSVLIASSYMPKGQVERADGGFKFSGRWSFSSGVDHASWLFLGGIVSSKNGVPDYRTFLVPRSDVLDQRQLAHRRPQGHRQQGSRHRRRVRPRVSHSSRNRRLRRHQSGAERQSCRAVQAAVRTDFCARGIFRIDRRVARRTHRVS